MAIKGIENLIRFDASMSGNEIVEDARMRFN